MALGQAADRDVETTRRRRALRTGREHGVVALAESGVPYTILRPAWYLQNLHGAKGYLEQGMFSMPWPEDMVWAATDVEDLARAAAAFFEQGPANRGFDIHLPGGVTAAAICRAVEHVTGHAGPGPDGSRHRRIAAMANGSLSLKCERLRDFRN